jgi:hypothetical protein
MLRGTIAAGVVLAVLVTANLEAQEPAPVSWNVTLENDKWGDGGDRHYTHGTRITRRSDARPEWLRRAAAPLRCLACTEPDGFEIEIGQEIYTPEDTWSSSLVADDRPYAGWAYAKLAVIGEREVTAGRTAFNSLGLTLGVVGPAARAEETQTLLHREKGVVVSQGWDNQLANEAGLVLTYTRGVSKQIGRGGPRVRHEVVPYFVGELGNVRTNVGGGIRWRAGRNLPSTSAVTLPGWHAFIDVGGQAVARNVLLDGNSGVESHSVPKEPFVVTVGAGLEYRSPRFRVSFSHAQRSREFVGQRELDSYGAITFAVNP